MKNPSYTRVSFQDSAGLGVQEATVLTQGENIKYEEICGIPYILVDTEDGPPLFDLSFTHAVFEYAGGKLTPLPRPVAYFIKPEISSILKYQGKTNELFTRLMLNLAIHSCKQTGQLNILDPMAGKGTTLYEALIKGHNAYGIEIDQKLAYESYTYVKKYLETGKFKHVTHTEKFTGQGDAGRFTATKHQIAIEKTCQFEIMDADARNAGLLFKKNFFDVILADLPYGVQHGSKTGGKPKKGGITRNAFTLVEESMDGLVRVLKPGGVIALAWNTFLIKRTELEALFTQHNLELCIDADFTHRVDQAIDRDIIIGRKK